MRPASASPATARRIAISRMVAQGRRSAAEASTPRTSGVRINPSPVMRLAIAVAKISTPGTLRSNGVANISPTPTAVAPMTTTWPRRSSAANSWRRIRAALIRLTAPAGP
jgi:hypothetical protein